MTNRSRILIADDHNLVAELCKRLLEMEFEVVGVVSDGRALVRAAGELKPDVIVLDIAMPVLNGLDAGRQVKEMLPAVKLIYLTMNPDTEVAAEAFRRGASGYLLKTCANNALALDAFFLHWSKYLDEKHRTPKPRHLRNTTQPGGKVHSVNSAGLTDDTTHLLVTSNSSGGGERPK